ncbi:collagen alpha-1(VII) chain isoform X2 [Hydra vulgaris]|uniref:collagen alpha-1(VII) chain isoform X2 n=1 Tax=Hydra vulgaris TaxID=6087 RepID=UPI001F5F600E|nr:collagen alpha-1(VII) chain-like isoform X2 [Hydra vulgaris]
MMLKLICLIPLFSLAVESQDITSFRIVSPIYKTRVDVAWDAVPNATSYKVTGLSKMGLIQQYSSSNKITLSVLPGASYLLTCMVYQFNNMITTLTVKTKNTLSVTTNSNIFPDVTNLVLLPSSTSLRISWDTFSNATLYTVVYTKSDISDERTLQTNQTFANIVDLKSMTSYSVMVLVSSINNIQPNYAAQSSWYNFYTTDEPPEITNFRVISPIYKTRVDVAWDAVPNATSYIITAHSKTAFIQQYSSNNKTTLSLLPGNTYVLTCMVYQFNNMNTTLTVKTKYGLNVTTNSDIFPDVTNLILLPTSTSLRISWDTFLNATLYTVVYTGGDISDEMTLQTIQTFENIVGLKSMTSYSVMVLVSSINNIQPNYAAQSSWYSFTTTNELQEITNFRVVSPIYKTTVDVAWDAVPNATSYIITAHSKTAFIQQYSLSNKTTLSLLPGDTYVLTCMVYQFNNMNTTLTVKTKYGLNVTTNSESQPSKATQLEQITIAGLIIFIFTLYFV